MKYAPDRDVAAPPVPDRWNDATRAVIGCAMEAHSHLGRGLSERIYEEALIYELTQRGMAFQRQAEFRVRYKDILLPVYRLDLVVENLVVVELKAVEEVSPAHLSQPINYLRLAEMPLGLLINFNVHQLKDGVFRRINDRLHPIVHPSPPTR